VAPGDCLALAGPSGFGKSAVLKLIHGRYLPLAGRILIRHEGRVVDLAREPPRLLLEVRRRTLGYVSQFLRVLPRVAALDVVAEPVIAQGVAREEARARAGELLARLSVPQRLWSLPPATFSGGEQQRVNLARAFAPDYRVMLLDEPMASLDAADRAVVIELIGHAKARCAALVGAFHDHYVSSAVASRTLELTAAKVRA